MSSAEFKSSARSPKRTQWIALVMLLASAACVADERNEPLPRMGRTTAESSAQHLTEVMAEAAGATISKGFVKPFSSRCVGMKNEVPEDGRFLLDYYTRVDVQVDRHFKAVSRMRRLLEKKSFRIEGYQQIEGERQSVNLNAVSRKNFYSVFIAGDYKEDQLRLSIHTPCLLPPGRTQKMY